MASWSVCNSGCRAFFAYGKGRSKSGCYCHLWIIIGYLYSCQYPGCSWNQYSSILDKRLSEILPSISSSMQLCIYMTNCTIYSEKSYIWFLLLWIHFTDFRLVNIASQNRTVENLGKFEIHDTVILLLVFIFSYKFLCIQIS